MGSPTGKVVDSELEAFDPVAEAKLVRKLDFRLLPLLALSYMLCYFDVSPGFAPSLVVAVALTFFGALALQRRKRSCRWSYY